MSLIGFRDHNQARCVLVEPVDNAWPADTTDPRQTVPAMGNQCIHQSASPIPGRWVNDHAGSLVEHEEVIVLVNDVEGQVLREGLGWFRLGDIDRDDVSSRDGGLRAGLFSIEKDVADYRQR